MAVRITVRASGVREAIERLGNPDGLIRELDRVTEKHTRLMANEASHAAPVKTGRLASSIPPSVEKEQEMVWIFGSDVEYAQRQEYEHRTKKAFFRKAIWDGRASFREEIRNIIRDLEN
jgi:hypothetical protein